MKTIYKYIIFLFCMIAYMSSNAQGIQVSRPAFPTTVQSCSTITIVYTITANQNANSLNIAENFNLGGCENPISNPAIIGGPSNASVSLTSNGINLALTNVSSGTQYILTVQLTLTANNANRSVTICSTNGAIVTSTPAVPITNTAPGGCITINNVETWASTIYCAAVTGWNCRTYTVNVRDINCISANMYGAPSFRFKVSAGGVIGSVTGNNPGINAITGIGSNTVFFTSLQNTWLSQITSQTYTFTVTYPCNLFPVNSNVTAEFRQNPPINTTYGLACPLPANPVNILIDSSSFTHPLQAPELEDNLLFTQNGLFVDDGEARYDASKNSPGCNSKIRLRYNNLGSTSINNLTINLPIPPQIQLNQVCDNALLPIRRFQLNNNATWINGTPNTTQIGNVTRLELGWNTVNPQLNPPNECGANGSNLSFREVDLCFRIRPATAIGTNIVFNSNYTATDIVDCTAANCPPYISQTRTGDAAPYTIRVVAPTARPALDKKMINDIVHPGNVLYPEEYITIELYIKNSGSGNLVTTATDIISADFDNIVVTATSYKLGTSNVWNTVPPAGFTCATTVAGNTVSANLNIPGICDLSAAPACCNILYNEVRITLRARVRPCMEAKSAINRFDITGFTFDRIDVVNSNRFRYRITNFNQIQVQKSAKGNAATDYSNTLTQVSPNGDIDYRIRITNVNPQPWTGLVIADIMPYIGDSNLGCGPLAPRGSQFNAPLRAPITAADIQMTNCPNITGYNVTYTASQNPIIQSMCNAGQFINDPFSGTNNLGFQIVFDGTVDCGCEIVINVPARVTTPNLVGGEIATNQVSFITNENRLPATSAVDAEILTWQLNCCADNAIKLGAFKVHAMETALDPSGAPEFTSVTLGYLGISTNSNIPVKEVRMTIIDFDFKTDNPECALCYNKSNSLGTFRGGQDTPTSPWLWAWPLPNPAPNTPPTGLIVQPVNSFITYNQVRETIWGLGNPINLATPMELRTTINVPLQRNLDCCDGGEIYICFKIEVTDVNCKTCEIIRCETIPWRKKRT